MSEDREYIETEQPDPKGRRPVSGTAQPVQNVKEDGVTDAKTKDQAEAVREEMKSGGKVPGEGTISEKGEGNTGNNVPDSAPPGAGGSGGADGENTSGDSDSSVEGDGPSGGAA